jgi:hypothetical protein
MTAPIDKCSGELICYAADFLDDTSLARFSVTSQGYSKILENIWKTRYEKKGKSNSYFTLSQHHVTYRRSYAFVINFVRYVHSFASSAVSRFPQFIITNPKGLKRTLQDDCVFTRFDADYMEDLPYVPVSFSKFISFEGWKPVLSGGREHRVRCEGLKKVPVCVSIIRNIYLPHVKVLCLAANPPKDTPGLAIETSAADRMQLLELNVKKSFEDCIRTIRPRQNIITDKTKVIGYQSLITSDMIKDIVYKKNLDGDVV